MLKAKIYFLLNPITEQPFYVGLTGNSLEERLLDHLRKNKKAKEILSQGVLPSIELIEEVDGDVSGITERYWIEQFIAWGFELTNKRTASNTNICPYPTPYTYKEAAEKSAVKMDEYKQSKDYKIHVQRCIAGIERIRLATTAS